MPQPRLASLAVRAAIVFVVTALVAFLVLSRTLSNGPVPMHVRWKAGTSATARAELERRYHLTRGQQLQGATWAYLLADTSTGNIRAMVQDPAVEDTEDINRIKFRPRFSNDRTRRLEVFPLAAGLVVALLVVARAFVGGSTQSS